MESLANRETCPRRESGARGLAVALFALAATVASATTYLSVSDSGLVLAADASGYRIPDFSHAGYLSSNASLPTFGVEYTSKASLSNPSGDETARIQKAIDTVAAMPLNAHGYRGAVTLGAGTWKVTTLRIGADGVVLRGAGPGSTTVASADPDGVGETIRLGSGTATATATSMFEDGRSGTKWNITTSVVHAGDTQFDVASGHRLAPGDRIIIEHPCTQAWLDAVDQGGSPDAADHWAVGSVPIRYYRYVRKVSGNTITIDAPVMYSLVRARSQCFVYRYTARTYQKIGIENLTVDHITKSSTDEGHLNDCVRFNHVENGWARNVTVQNYKRFGFMVCESSRITIEDSRAIDPHSVITSAKRYGFDCTGGQLVLFKDCYGRRNRHTFVTNGHAMDSGNVFLRCIAEDAYAASEHGHQRWASGSLFDGCIFRNVGTPEAGAKFSSMALWLGNHGNNSNGHGWSAVTAVAYRCVVESGTYAIVAKPPTGMNWVIACTGDFRSVHSVHGDYPGALRIATSGTLPPSLFEAQLKQRRGGAGTSSTPAAPTSCTSKPGL